MECKMIVSCWEFGRKSLRGTNTPHSFTHHANQLTKPLECLNYIHNMYDTTIKNHEKAITDMQALYVYCNK